MKGSDVEMNQTSASKNATVPSYWRSSLEDVDKAVQSVKKGKISSAISAGGRNIYVVEYGVKNNFSRMANLSSAAGSGDTKCYADKTADDIRPTLMLVGSVHGAEFEGTVALLNLINIIENGTDYAGNAFPQFDNIIDKINIVIIPCLNPDGRARVPFNTVLGMNYEEFSYWGQGTWQDGSLAGWPGCKRVHPILEHTDFLGSYYNDDGINIMHDDFFSPMAKETELLLRIADEYVPDATVLLHGGSRSPNMLLQPQCVPLYFKQETQKIALDLQRRCFENGLRGAYVDSLDFSDSGEVVKMNAVTAITLKCGELCMTYETNQGLDGCKLSLSHDEIYQHHILLFEEMTEYIINLKKRRVSNILI